MKKHLKLDTLLTSLDYRLLSIGLFVWGLVSFLTPSPAFAAGIPNPSEWLNAQNSGGLPIGGLDFITGNVVTFVMSLLFFLVIVLSFIYLMIGAISLMTSGGNKEGTAKAKGTITYALIGLVIGVASLIILNVVGEILGVNLSGRSATSTVIEQNGNLPKGGN